MGTALQTVQATNKVNIEIIHGTEPFRGIPEQLKNRNDLEQRLKKEGFRSNFGGFEGSEIVSPQDGVVKVPIDVATPGKIVLVDACLVRRDYGPGDYYIVYRRG